MIEQKKIDQIATEVAKKNLGASNVSHATSEPIIGSEGEDALRITIVIQDDSLPNITGDAVIDNLVDLHHRLQEAGEDRPTIVSYATHAELTAVDSEF